MRAPGQLDQILDLLARHGYVGQGLPYNRLVQCDAEYRRVRTREYRLARHAIRDHLIDLGVLTIVPRDNPSRPMDVAVLDTIDGPYFAAYTEGGRLSLSEVTSPASTAEAIEWTLIGR